MKDLWAKQEMRDKEIEEELEIEYLKEEERVERMAMGYMSSSNENKAEQERRRALE